MVALFRLYTFAMSHQRRVAHLDMDAFYASVELLRYPQLRGQAVVIGGRSTKAPVAGPDGVLQFAQLKDYTGRGVVTTSTYEARALGVFSAMGMMKAARLAPDAVVLPADFNAYRDYSRRFKAAVRAIAPQVEDRGIDEIYIDLTLHEQDSDTLARMLKRAVFEATGLTCSVGISPNKLLSKIASDLNKPDGITILEPGDLQTRIWPLPVGKINGIGPRARTRLESLGIFTIRDLAQAKPHLLQAQFGLGQARWMLQVAQGVDERPVVTASDPKSVSRETTFERDLHVVRDKAALSAIFSDLCQRVSQDLKNKGCAGRTVGIKLRFEDFHTVTRDCTLADPTDDPVQIRRAAGSCLKRVDLSRRIRLLGVRVGTLSAGTDAGGAILHEPVQLSLY